jgi:hypothetical protein
LKKTAPPAVGLADHGITLDPGIRPRAPAVVLSGGSLPSRLLSLMIERLRQRVVLLGADNDEIDEPRRLREEPTARPAPDHSEDAR